jgi:hypothetical protein
MGWWMMCNKPAIGYWLLANRLGQTLVEILLAIAIAALVLPALLTGMVATREGKAQQEQRTYAAGWQREAVEAIRSIRDAGWAGVENNGTYQLSIVNGQWSFVAGTETANGYTRSIVVDDVYRDASGNVVTSGGSLDPSSKKITVTVGWQTPRNSSVASTFYITRYKDNLAYIQTTKPEFDLGLNSNTEVLNAAGGEIALLPNNKAKWCTPTFSSATIDLPDGPPVAVVAQAGVTTSVPNDVFVALAPADTTSTKMAYVNVTANTDPPVTTLKGVFTLDPAKYSSSGLVPTGIGFDNNFKTNDVKYFKSSSGSTYGVLATNLPNKEMVVVRVNNGTTDTYRDPTNKIYEYWSYFNTKIYGTAFNNPTANASDTGGDGNGFQSNPGNAYVSDGSFATDSNSGNGNGTSCTGSDKDKHRFYNFNFNVPTGVTINGIELNLVARTDSTTGSPKMCAQVSWDGGSSWTTAKSTSNLTTNAATYVLGGSSDTWGRVWSDTNFSNTNFRLRIINVAGNTSRDFSLDWVGAKVHFTGGTTTSNDQAPFGYGATDLATNGNTAYMVSGGYLYAFDLANIDTKSQSSELDQVGCRILLDGYDCLPGSGTDKKYAAGETGSSWSDTTSPAHSNCSDGGNIELYANHQISPVTVGSNKYVYVSVGAGTNPELNIVDVSSPPTDTATLASASCGRGGNTGWKVVGTLDFNSKSGTEEAANSVYASADGTRAYMSSNGGIDANNDSQPDSYQFYVIDTSNKAAPKFLSGTPSTGAQSGYYYASGANGQMYPRRSLTALTGQRAILVGKDGTSDANDAAEYQVLNISTEATPAFCGSVNFDQGFNDLTSVSEADTDNFVYMVANTNDNELKIIQGGPDGYYTDSGVYESSIQDAGYSRVFNRISSAFNKPGNTDVKFQVAIADAVGGSCSGASFVFVGPDGSGSTYFTDVNNSLPFNDDGVGYENPGRCAKYKAFLSTTDFAATPQVLDVTINYSP